MVGDPGVGLQIDDLRSGDRRLKLTICDLVIDDRKRRSTKTREPFTIAAQAAPRGWGPAN
jgi:hypothetical protein